MVFWIDYEKLMVGFFLVSLVNFGYVVVDDFVDFVLIYWIEGWVLGGWCVVDGFVMVGLNWVGIWVVKKVFKSVFK